MKHSNSMEMLFIPIVVIVWIHNNHYELLLPINLNIYDYPIELHKIQINTDKY